MTRVTNGKVAREPQVGEPGPGYPVRSVSLSSFYGEVQEMGRTGYARVVVADGLLAPAGQLGVVQVQVGLHERAQVGFDGGLVLGRRGNDAGGGDEAAGVDLVPVPQGPPRRLGRAEPS